MPHGNKTGGGKTDDAGPQLNDQAFPDWIELFRVLDDGVDCLPRLSSFFVLSIDSRSRRDNGESFKTTPWLKNFFEDRRKLMKAVSDDVEKSLFSPSWGQEHRRSNHLFRALQRIKRNLVLAKLQLCWWGAWSFRMIVGAGPPSIQDRRLDHFIAVRAGVMVKLGDAVARLNDLQGQFERSLDLGPQQVARPLGGRRRHGALSAAFLHNRSHELWTEIHQLLTVLGVKESNPKAIRPLTAHRWQHDTRSSNHVVFDDTTGRRHVDDNPASAIDFVISSYWAPDRPDLQMMIAHEAAAAVLGQRLPLADRMQLSTGTGPFAKLLRTLNHAIVHSPSDDHAGLMREPARAQRKTKNVRQKIDEEDTSSTTELDEEDAQHPDPAQAQPDSANDEFIGRHFDLSSSFARAKRSLLPQIAADLLATSIYGPAYLFALFQTSFGRGMEQLFRLPSGQVDLGIAREAWMLSHLSDEVPLEWYVRIKVVCDWIRAIEFEDERSQLGITLVRGIETLSDQLLKRIRTLYHGEARQWPVLWQELTRELCHIVKTSSVGSLVSTWRRERLKPYETTPSEKARQSIRRTSRSSRPMPPDLAGFVKKVLITQKCATPGRSLHRELERRKPDPIAFDDAVGLFNYLYLQDPSTSRPEDAAAEPAPGEDMPSGKSAAAVKGRFRAVVDNIRQWQYARRHYRRDHELGKLAFFRSLDDIPWESAIMRAL